jgi:hypothetical protein
MAAPNGMSNAREVGRRACAAAAARPARPFDEGEIRMALDDDHKPRILLAVPPHSTAECRRFARTRR